MSETLSLLPLPFWLSLLALGYFGFKAWNERETTVGIPMLMVLFTVATWYGGDALYNDYTEYLQTIGRTALDSAWWEVLLFICTFGILAPVVHRSSNRKYLGKRSNLLLLVRHGVTNANNFQTQIDSICWILALFWMAIMLIALVRTNFDFQGLFMPYLGSKADPWSRGRIGSGFDSLIALAGYLLIGLTAAFGVLAALATRPATRLIATTICLLALPTYIFDRTRSVMLATLLPGFCAWVFLRVRGGIFIRLAVLVAGFLVLEAWLKFVIENRSENSIAAAFQQELGSHSNETQNMKHLGLNMFEELGHINAFISDGSYRPNWGARYFAEVVNPIPRVLWPGKPLIGIDYAIARGMGYEDAGGNQAGVGASISTGMIGQGVVNFGRFFGPVAAALLMAFWAALLARQDMLASETGRLFLYAIGLFLTFNMGRDITLLVTYPFCFGYLLLLAAKSWQPAPAGKEQARPSSAIGTVNRASRTGKPAVIVNGAQRQSHRRISSPLQKKNRRN
jgi:hypothetical protein